MKSSLFLIFSSTMVLFTGPVLAQKLPPGGYQNRSPSFTPVAHGEEPARKAEPAPRHATTTPTIGDADAMGTGEVEGVDVPEEPASNVSPRTKSVAPTKPARAKPTTPGHGKKAHAKKEKSSRGKKAGHHKTASTRVGKSSGHVAKSSGKQRPKSGKKGKKTGKSKPAVRDENKSSAQAE